MKKSAHYSRVVICVCLFSIVTFSNIYWLQPLLPIIQKEFQVSSLAANLSMSAPLLGMGLGLLVFASLSDAIGRCKVLLAGTAAGITVSVALPMVENYHLFLSLRFLQGMFLAVCPALAVPLMGEELRKSWLAGAVGFYVASNTLGGICSRLLGGLSAEHLGDWAYAGYVIAGISVILYAIIYYLIPVQRHFKPAPLKVGKCLKAYGHHLKNPQLVILYLLIGLAFGTFVNLSNYLMMVLSDFPYNLPSDIRSLMFLTLLGGTTSSSLAGKFAKKHSPIAGVAFGATIMLAANFLMSWSNLYTMVVGMVMVSVGFFFCHAQASTLIGMKVTKSKGSAQALYSLFYYSGASLGVFFLEPFYQGWGWQGILDATRIALALCILLVIIYQCVSVYKNSHSHAMS
ncbi:MFS transporter [Vibrio mytili]|uniref:Major facilitator transporter n=1 Tax=Vibrio mytili TaxID=50718 RepID=A0A0C3IDJ7_9VIBR|nr:MFS transporter [Vibrio mytili]KIN12427.1 major facilitator transporter [Vibrio mytili]